MQRYSKHAVANAYSRCQDAFFTLVTEDDEVVDETTTAVISEYESVANDLSTRAYFYRCTLRALPNHHHIAPTPMVLVFKDGNVVARSTNASLAGMCARTRRVRTPSDWLQAERFTAFPQLTYTSMRDMGTCCNRLLALLVSDYLDRSKMKTLVFQVHNLVDTVAKKHMHTALEVGVCAGGDSKHGQYRIGTCSVGRTVTR
jgi:hypothetical protein